jgi:hypothetical protein
MYSPSLQHLLVQDHIQDLHRSRQTRSTQPIITNERIAARLRQAAKLSAYLERTVERFVGHPAPEAYAF